MHKRAVRWTGASLAFVILAACHDDGFGGHGCPLSYGDGWRNYGLTLEHVEPQQCPVFINQPGTPLTTGGTVVDGGMLREMERSNLVVFDANAQPVNGEVVYFGEDIDGRWIAPTDVAYAAGRVNLAPDLVSYDLFLRDDSHGPWAEMQISYTTRVVAGISGPSFVEPGATYTWSANVTQGIGPYQYRWYRNWNLVGTGPSYTGGGGSDTTYLRLDVTDSRGEVDSDGRKLMPTHCGTRRAC